MPLQCKYVYMFYIIHAVYNIYSIDIVHKINCLQLMYNLGTGCHWPHWRAFCSAIKSYVDSKIPWPVLLSSRILGCWLTKTDLGELAMPISWDFFVQLKVCSAKRPGHRLRRPGAWSSHSVWSASPQKHCRKQWIEKIGERHSFGFNMIFNEFNIFIFTNLKQLQQSWGRVVSRSNFQNKFVATLGHALTLFRQTNKSLAYTVAHLVFACIWPSVVHWPFSSK